MKIKLKRNSFIISVLFSSLVLGLYGYGYFEGAEYASLDYRFKIRGPEKIKAPIVLAKIDEASLDHIGKFPWPRTVYAKFLDYCKKSDVKCVVFDIIFQEPDRERPQNDRNLIAGIRRNGRVVSGFDFRLVTQPQEISQDDEGNIVRTETDVVEKEDPLPEIVKYSKGFGFFNAWPEPDGNLRRAYVTYEHEDELYYSLNLAAMAFAKGISPEEFLESASFKTGNPGKWGYQGRQFLVNFRGPQDGEDAHGQKIFQSYSFSEIYDGQVPPEWLKDKIIFIGSTALGAYDHFNTSVQSQFPGVYFHATVLDNLWEGDYLREVSNVLTFILIGVFGLLAGTLTPRISPWKSAIVTGLAGAAFWAAGYILMAERLIYIELVSPTLSLFGCYLVVFFYRFLVEQKEKAGIKKAFGVYVNPHVVDQIAKNPDGLKLGGEMREMSVMFSDVAGFTTISEKLTPQELVQLLNLYLTAMTDTIMRYDGTVDKYEGDAIMAFWGAPLVQPQHAKQACNAVLENRERLAQLNVELEQKGMNKLFARCGINTGLMNVGNMGSSQKFNYTVMGDAVNLASRLEGANKQYGTALMISEMTYAQVKDDVEVRELDLLRVKGKKIPIKVFELVCRKGQLADAQRRAFDLYNKGIELYRSRNFRDALKKFQEVGDHIKEDPPSATYVERCKTHIENPPPKDWDGVYVMTTK